MECFAFLPEKKLLKQLLYYQNSVSVNPLFSSNVYYLFVIVASKKLSFVDQSKYFFQHSAYVSNLSRHWFLI